MKKIVVATNNEGKLKEVQEIFSNFIVLSLKDFDTVSEVYEDGDTFEENAIKKAKTIAQTISALCIADDSGICIDEFDGWPGINTKRWLQGSDRDRNLAILEKMKGLPKERRKVEFVTSIALSDGNHSAVETKTIYGYIADKIRGNNGFGFDEIFELEDGRTLAELSSDEKNQISSRKKALEAIKPHLTAFC